MSQELIQFEGDDSARTWRSPGNDVFIPPTLIKRIPPLHIRIIIKTPVTRTPKQPPSVRTEGAADWGESVRRTPGEIPQWEKDYLERRRNGELDDIDEDDKDRMN